MVAVTTSIDSTTGGLKISWTAPNSNSYTISSYLIEIADSLTATWNADTTNCDGSSSTVMSNMYCIIPMSTLTSAPYGYLFDQLVVVRASAQNTRGSGSTSTPNSSGARIRKVPNAMSTPTQGPSSDTDIVVTWVALTGAATGNSAILTYDLYWDNGSGTTNVELIDSLVTSYTVSGLTGGATYLFKVRAKNIYGYGAFSSELTIVPSDVPDQVSIPTTALSTTSVIISWAAPDAHSAPIDYYEISFLKADGTYGQDATNCDGTGTIATSHTCTVPMASIVSLTSLAVDTLIQVKVRAHNQNGWGSYSQLNIVGATIETLPTQASTPSFDPVTSTNTMIVLTWSALTGSSTGGSSVSITNYEIYWN